MTKHKGLYNLGSGLRIYSAEQTLNRIQPYIKLAGITRIADLTKLDDIDIPVFTCIRPLSKNLSTSQGKGISTETAQCSAYMEAIELFYAENVKGDLISSMRKLPENQFISPADLPRALLFPTDITNVEIEWNKGVNLLDNHEYYIPTEYISFDLTNTKPKKLFFTKTTTGLASGNNFQEALLHSLYEIIERDDRFIFQTLSPKEKAARVIKNETINSNSILELINKINKQGYRLFLFDISNKSYAHTIFAIIIDKNHIRKLGNFSGTGTHTNKNIATIRAITEAAQSRLTHIAGSRDDMFEENYQHDWSLPEFEGKINYTNNEPSIMENMENLDYSVLSLLENIKNSGYKKIITIPYTNKEDDITVLQTVIPGMKS